MLTPKITCCKECADIQPLIDEINCKLYKLSLDAYNNIVFGLGIPINHVAVLDLLNYKRILQYKLVNENYACEFTVNMIASKIKRYVAGCKIGCDCNEDDLLLPTYVFQFSIAAGLINPCMLTDFPTTLYSSTPSLTVNVTYLYLDSELTIPFNGDEEVFREESGGDAWSIASNGFVVNHFIC